MTDKERAVVMAYTGVTMLAGDKLGLFYQFVEQLLHRPVMTHELADERVVEEIKNAARPYFLALCETSRETSVGASPRCHSDGLKGRKISPVKERRHHATD